MKKSAAYSEDSIKSGAAALLLLLRKKNEISIGYGLVRMEFDLVESKAVTCRIDLYCSGCDVEVYSMT